MREWGGEPGVQAAVKTRAQQAGQLADAGQV